MPIAAAALRAWCREHGIKYVAAEQYPHTRNAAQRANVVCPASGVLLHFPRGTQRHPNLNAYVCWRGEDTALVEASVAWLKLARPERTSIRVLRCFELQEAEPAGPETAVDANARVQTEYQAYLETEKCDT